ncbi:YolD-like family protein [[Brevibacterium] frigoritolerans]|uniref:YolD-like family protein n=1 Tax=Peribacillus frigoritolerans TaxID=450367 RepID=A0A941FT73_9BACI|nr:YolD-like family protein [Peribacillus frigoritolerans]MDO7488517.1 YolD-like family protein [Peribacillus frigoritolerans]
MVEKKGITTIIYYKEGVLKTCKGQLHKLNLNEQTLSLKDENQKIFSIRLSRIMEIY